MKKMIVFCAVAFSSIAVLAQHQIKESAVPAGVKASFQKSYPNTKANWEKEKTNYEVGFTHDGQKMSLLIDGNGTILETETDMSARQLPGNVLSYMKSHYKGKKIIEAAKIVKANGDVVYEAEIKGKDVLFDSNGKFLKTEKTEAEEKGEKEND